MKMAKKLLALFVLTGCDSKNAATAKNIADALNSMAAGMGADNSISFSEGDSTAKKNARKGADYLSTVDIAGAESILILKRNTAKAMGYCTEDNKDTEYVWITYFEKESKLDATAQAMRIFSLESTINNGNIDPEIAHAQPAKERKVSVADFTGKDGKKYRLIVLTAKAIPGQN